MRTGFAEPALEPESESTPCPGPFFLTPNPFFTPEPFFNQPVQ